MHLNKKEGKRMIKEQLRLIVDKIGTPVFIYDEAILRANVRRIQLAAEAVGLLDRLCIFATYFANSNPHLFRTLANMGLGITVQTPEEMAELEQSGIHARLNVSPSVLSDDEMCGWAHGPFTPNLTSLEEVKSFHQLFPSAYIACRLDMTQDGSQRLGIKRDQWCELVGFCASYRGVIRTLHSYIGTSSSFEDCLRLLKQLLEVRRDLFPQVNQINLGGGFGFNYAAKTPDDKHFPWQRYFHEAASLLVGSPKDLRLAVEPGREIFADIGGLLLSVKRPIRTTHHTILATDGAYSYAPSMTAKPKPHQVRFFDDGLNELEDRSASVLLGGCTTKIHDFLQPDPSLAPANLDEVRYVWIEDLGAYGETQHMRFLNKRPAAACLLNGNFSDPRIITERGGMCDGIRNVPNRPSVI